MNDFQITDNPFSPYELKISEDERRRIIANTLKNLRIKNGYKQKDIAELLQISQSNYSGYEVGKYEIKAETLVRLSFLYKISLDDLMSKHQLYPSLENALKDYESMKANLEEMKKDFPNSKHADNPLAKAMMDFLENMEIALDQYRDNELPK